MARTLCNTGKQRRAIAQGKPDEHMPRRVGAHKRGNSGQQDVRDARVGVTFEGEAHIAGMDAATQTLPCLLWPSRNQDISAFKFQPRKIVFFVLRHGHFQHDPGVISEGGWQIDPRQGLGKGPGGNDPNRFPSARDGRQASRPRRASG